MVQTTPTPDIASGATIRDRGMVGESAAVAMEYRTGRFMFYPAPFWGPVIAGTLFVMTTFVFSWYLMLGCTVGVGADHLIALGWGAAVWMWITSAIAFLVGGAIASMISAPRNFGWLKGAAIWGLSVPLSLIAYSFAAGNGFLATVTLPQAGMAHEAAGFAPYTVHYDFAWSIFIALGLGLIFALIGSMAGRPYRADVLADTSIPADATH